MYRAKRQPRRRARPRLDVDVVSALPTVEVPYLSSRSSFATLVEEVDSDDHPPLSSRESDQDADRTAQTVHTEPALERTGRVLRHTP